MEPFKVKLEEVVDIACGENFSYAFVREERRLYSWGMGMQFVLLTGDEEDYFEPFPCKPKILKDEYVIKLAGGSQHVLYLANEEPDKQSPSEAFVFEQKKFKARKAVKSIFD